MTRKTLNELSSGEKAVIETLYNKKDMRRRLYDLGFAPKSSVCCAFAAPSGDPKAFVIKGTVIALRKEDSSLIMVKPL